MRLLRMLRERWNEWNEAERRQEDEREQLLRLFAVRDAFLAVVMLLAVHILVQSFVLALCCP